MKGVSSNINPTGSKVR